MYLMQVEENPISLADAENEFLLQSETLITYVLDDLDAIRENIEAHNEINACDLVNRCSICLALAQNKILDAKTVAHKLFHVKN